MATDVKNLKLASYDSLFESTSTNKTAQQSSVCEVRIDSLHPFKNHPFKLYNEEKMAEMVESVKQHGVIVPILVRPVSEGNGYEIVAGHNRAEAAKRAKLETIPTNIREMDDDTAILLMVDSNLRQRDKLLPSEKAFAYKMKLEAIKRQGQRTDLTSRQVGAKSRDYRSDEIIASNSEESARQILRYIRLTELIPGLLDMVDEENIPFGVAVNLSYLDRDQQCDLQQIMNSEECVLSLAQSERLKDRAQRGVLDYSSIETILTETKPIENKLVIKNKELFSLFPKNYTPAQMEMVIINLVKVWRKKEIERREADR